MTRTGYLAPIGLEERLKQELPTIVSQYGRLLIAEGPPQSVHWAQNIWFDPQFIPFHSVSDAAKKLRSLKKLWSHYPYKNIRRGELISAQLPYFSPKPLSFPNVLPEAPLGSWTLIDSQTLLASPCCSSPFAHGEVHFQESRIPPGRAYLKLWEILLKMGRRPKAKEVCLDLGASPGSWTWALQQMGAEVVAVDRALLSPSLAQLPNTAFLKKDAFSLFPGDLHLPRLDWVFCDVVCAPQKLFDWVQRWLGEKVHFVCTLKFQGNGGTEIIREFEKIEGGRLVHLFHNKHELTWYKLSS